MTDDSNPRFRAGVHVQLYLWIALLVVSVVPAMLISRALSGAARLETALTVFALLLAAFQGLFWYARRRCSSEDLSAWDGLRYITSYMTIGVGPTSLCVATPSAIVATLGIVGIAALSVLDSDASVAQQRFRSMVLWFSRHRMYQ